MNKIKLTWSTLNKNPIKITIEIKINPIQYLKFKIPLKSKFKQKSQSKLKSISKNSQVQVTTKLLKQSISSPNMEFSEATEYGKVHSLCYYFQDGIATTTQTQHHRCRQRISCVCRQRIKSKIRPIMTKALQ